jgi:hypothetical protein
MKHEAVKSSVVSTMGHDPQANVMEVRFKGGKLYTYGGVTVDQFESIRHAESVGKALNEFLKEGRKNE